MKSTIGLGLAMALLASTAVAQQPPSPPDSPDQNEGGMTQPSSEDHMNSMDHMDEGMRHHGMGGHRPPPRAAAFRIETNDLKIGMKCPDDEPLKSCADFTLQLLDKLGAMQKR